MRLIDADAFIRSLPDFDMPGDTIEACELRIRLMEFPTIDPVKHGHWIMKEHPIMPEVDECDQCHFSVVYGNGFNFCPKCGAKMND